MRRTRGGWPAVLRKNAEIVFPAQALAQSLDGAAIGTLGIGDQSSGPALSFTAPHEALQERIQHADRLSCARLAKDENVLHQIIEAPIEAAGLEFERAEGS